MRRLVNLMATVALMAAPGISAAQQSVATRPTDAVEKRLQGELSACANVASWINGGLRTRSAVGADNSSAATVPREILLGNLRADDLDCEVVPPLVPGIAFELTKIFYDRTLHSWEFLMRCSSSAECVPFLVRWPQPVDRDTARQEALEPAHAPNSHANAPETHSILRPGETVMLVWDQDGIRVVLPVICLERGNVGDSIRVRIKSGTRVLRAQIVNESLLRASL
jgi:Chaperone for flagella basal body P-ring formation